MDMKDFKVNPNFATNMNNKCNIDDIWKYTLTLHFCITITLVWKINSDQSDPSLTSSHWLWPDLDAPGCCWCSNDQDFNALVPPVRTASRTENRKPHTAKGRIEYHRINGNILD